MSRAALPDSLVPPRRLVLLSGGILGVGAALRVALTLSSDFVNSGPDAPSYHASALALIDGGLLADSQQLRVFPWGFSAMLAVTYQMTGRQDALVFTLLGIVVFLASASFAAYWIARVFKGAVAVVWLVTICFSPLLIDANASLMYEGWLLSLSCICLGAILMELSHGHRALSALLLVAAGGGIIWIHPRSAFIVVAIVVYLILARHRYWTAFLVSLVAVLAVAGLIARNVTAVGSSSVSANQGGNIVIGLPLDAFRRCSTAVYEPPGYAVASFDGDVRLLRCGVSEIANEPLLWLIQMPAKLLDYSGNFLTRGIGRLGSLDDLSVDAEVSAVGLGLGQVRLLQGLGFLVMVISALIALRASAGMEPRKRFVVHLCAAVVALGFASAAVFYGYPRFRVPYAPWMLLMAAIAVSCTVSCLKANAEPTHIHRHPVVGRVEEA